MIKHVLSDGREVKSIEGMVIPATGRTAAVYNLAAEFLSNHPEIIHQKKEAETNATV